MKKFVFPAALAASFLLLSGCMVSFGPPVVTNETVAVPGVPTLRLENSVGSIRIVASERTDVDVTMSVSQVSIGLFPGSLTPPESVSLAVDTTNGVGLRHDPFDARGVSVSYDIEAPLELAIENVTSSTGSINLLNVSGDPELTTSTGSITADGVSGTVSASTSTGSIKVINSDAVASLETSTGSITAEMRGLPGVSTIPISTGTGSVAIAVDPSLPLSIEAESGTGTISVHPDLDLDLTWYGNDRLEGTLNGGGTVLKIDTGTGSISLYALPVD